MTGLFKWWPRWEYVGTVTGGTRWWVLRQHAWWGRRAKQRGRPDSSKDYNHYARLVAAWRVGGPVPPLEDDTRPQQPAKLLSVVGGRKTKGSK